MSASTSQEVFAVVKAGATKQGLKEQRADDELWAASGAKKHDSAQKATKKKRLPKERPELSLPRCADLFFDPMEVPAVLPKANACSRVGIDRFILSCPVAKPVYRSLMGQFISDFKTKPLLCKRDRIRGLRTKVKLVDVSHSPNGEGDLQSAPQIGASPYTVELQLYHGGNGQYFGVHGNGGFSANQWRQFHDLLFTHFPVPDSVLVSRVELYCDFFVPFEHVAVLPLGTKHRFTQEANGFYWGSRASYRSVAAYDGGTYRPVGEGGILPCAHVEARTRARVAPDNLFGSIAGAFDKVGIYLASAPDSILVLPQAWRWADTRARRRFVHRVEAFRLHVDSVQIGEAIARFSHDLTPLTVRCLH